MVGEIVGVKSVNFTNEHTGELIKGVRLYIIAADVDCYGKSTCEIWVPSDNPVAMTLAPYVSSGEAIVKWLATNPRCDFSFRQNSKKLQQFELLKS